MTVQSRRLFGSRDLIGAWTARTLRGRYQQSALGWLWAVLQPVATVAIFTVVFTRFVPVDTHGVPYVLFSYTAVVPWTLLATSLPDMATALVQNMNLVTKIYFPREVLPLAALLARLADFGISALLLAILLVLYRAPVAAFALAYLPLLLLAQLMLMVGLGLGCAALNVFYRDVDPLLRLGLQVWFYATPVIYSASTVPDQWRTLYFLNPMAGIVVGYREILLFGRPPGPEFVPILAVTAVICLGGWQLFRRLEGTFADIV